MSPSDYVLSLLCGISSLIVYHFSWQAFSLQPPDPKVQSVFEYRHGRIGRGMRGKLSVGVIVA